MSIVTEYAYLGVGIYSVPEAARLTGLAPQRIRRWVRGYRYRQGDQTREKEPLWQTQHSAIDDELSLGFLDLMEVRFVNAFVELGVSLQSIRRAIEKASTYFDDNHALCHYEFLTDGRTIFLSAAEDEDDPELLDLVRSQFAFKKILQPYLRGLEYEDQMLARWWPLGRRRSVVIDPARSFGRPIGARSSVPTDLLAKAVTREGNVELVSRWYDVSLREVADAVAFEKSLAA